MERSVTIGDVVRKLGGRRVFKSDHVSEHDLIEAVRAGLPAAALDSVVEDFAGGVGGPGEIYRAVGSTRTLQRKRSDGARLSPHESDRLARVARLMVRAEEALGDRDKARRWFSQPNRALGNERPIALLDSDTGALSVERVLGRIEHGVYS
jgi:putative toxin-antitoxin system antitoxin component (TIGR02293 family)